MQTMPQNNKMRKYAPHSIVQVQISQPYHAPHPQNPQDERAMCTILYATRSALYASKLPHHFWSWAELYAVEKLNYIQQSTPQHDTPRYLLTGTPSYSSIFHEFGTLGWATVTCQMKHLDPRAFSETFIRAPNKFWVPTTGSGLWKKNGTVSRTIGKSFSFERRRVRFHPLWIPPYYYSSGYLRSFRYGID